MCEIARFIEGYFFMKSQTRFFNHISQVILLSLGIQSLAAQSAPCQDSNYRKFDFWIGEWSVYRKDGLKAGDSKITLILDSCVILEEWTSANPQKGIIYKGKSFNLFNDATKQWQQTWVDNTGNTTEFLRGEPIEHGIRFYADQVTGPDGKFFRRRLSFTQLPSGHIRQIGERSYDQGVQWQKEYDLEYRRKPE